MPMQGIGLCAKRKVTGTVQSCPRLTWVQTLAVWLGLSLLT